MISADVMSYLFDPAKATERLDKYEKEWGGPPAERMAAQMAEYRRVKGLAPVPGAPVDNAANAVEDGDNALPPADNAATPNSAQGVPE